MTLKVFIAGASSGLGEALAIEYAEAGATLGLAARRFDVLAKLRDRITACDSSPGRVEIYRVDVSDAADFCGIARDFIARHGTPDVVIACAGISVPAELERADSLAAFRDVLATNVYGTLVTFQPFVAAMKARGTGQLVGIGSVAGVRGMPGASGYSASKAAVMAFCEALRIDLRGTGVEVITICPGYVRTSMTAAVPYRQPFLIDARVFARRAVQSIAAGSAYTVIPWQMGWIARLLKLLPNGLYDAMMKSVRRRTPTDC